MAREVGLMEVSGRNVQRIGATTTPTDRAVGSSCSTDNGADKCRKQPSLFLCPNKQCTEEKTNMSRQIRKDAFNLDALQKEHQRKLAEMFNSKEHYKQRCITSDQLKKTLEDHVNALETSNKQLNDKILSLQNELKDKAAEGAQALKAYEKKAMEAQKAVEATLAQTAQDYRKLQDIYNHQTNRFQVVWREKEEMRLGIVQTKNNFRTEMELVVQENLSLRLELSEKNASLQAASKTESVRQELMREAKELMEDANDRTEAAAEELTAVKRDLQSKIDSLEEQVGKLKEECEIAKSESEKRKQELAEKEDTIAESFQLLEQMEKKKEQALQAKDHRTEKALETLQLENAKVQQLKEELMLTCANWKSKEEKCCKCMVKEDQSHQLEAALTAASAYSDRIKELEDELALVKEQAKKKEIEQEEAEQPTSTVPSSIASSPCPEQSRIKDSLKLRINLPRSRLLKRRKERRTDSLDSTLSELDSPPTMVVRHSAIDFTADQLMTSKGAPILSPQASTPISTSRSQSQDSTTSIPPRKRYRTGKYKGIVGRILEEKFQENQCLSKEHRDECCKLTKLNENQVNNWFHHRRKHGPLLSPVDTTATTKKQSRSYTLVPYPIRAILHAKFKQNNGELNEKEIEELGQQTKLSSEAVKRWFSIRAPLKKRVETPGSNQASISHKDGYAESVSNTQTEGSNQSEKGPTGNFSCVPGSQISHLNRLVQAVSSWAEKIEQDDQPNSSNAKDEVDSQSPSTSATFDSFAQQPDSILFNASHNSTFSVGETSQAIINPSILNVSPLEQDVVNLQLNNHQEGLRQTGQDKAAQILESHYQASPCRLKSCRLQEMCRLTGLTKKQVREWFKQRRKRDNPVDPLVNAHEGPQFACNNIQSTSFTLDDFLEGIFQRGCVPTIPDGWKKLSEETKVDVATLYQWFNQRFQFHQRAQQKAGQTTQKQWQKQIEGVLEKQFQNSPILNPLKKEYLCQKTGWTEAMITSWFLQRNQKKWNEDRNHTFNPFSLSYMENKFRNNNQADKMDMEEMKCLTGADPSQIFLWFETRRSHEHMKMPAKQMPRAIDANAFADFMARCNEAAGPSATLQHPNQVQPQGFAQQQGPFNFQPQHCTSNSLNFMQYMQQIPWSSEQDVAGRLSAPKQRRQKDVAQTNKFGPSMVSDELSHLNDPSIFNQSHSLPPAVNRILPQFSSTVLECFNKKN